MPDDLILIKNLLVRGVIGINDWEREVEQDILVNVALTADLTDAGKSDSIDATANYRTIAKEIIRHIETSERYTVEALAHDIVEICLRDQAVRSARVRIEKPGALRFAESVGVEIERSRQ